MTVRRARAADWEAILEIHRRAFDPEDVPRLVQELRASSVYVPELSLVAVSENRVVGHVMNTWSGLEGSTTRLLQLSPLGEPLLLVEGSPAYYGRFGFVRADERGLLPPPEALYDWAFQVAVLDEQAELPRGRVIYPEPFRR